MKKSQSISSVSIIIPVYNEESYLARCLEAIGKQTDPPKEVIVVDNNSTDRTVEIAKSFAFVTVISEKRQGRAYARTAGFNYATGDILARIDADSIVTRDWVARLKTDFADESLTGVTGLGKTNVLPWLRSAYGTFWSRVYFWSVHAWFGTITMWGANMAIRQSSWLEVKNTVCLDDAVVHEDQDLSLAIAALGQRIVQDNRLLIYTKGQDYFYWPKFYTYVWRSIQTKRTYTKRMNGVLKIGFWHLLLGGIVGIFMTLIFGIVSFLCWPITYMMFRISAAKQGQDTATLHRLK